MAVILILEDDPSWRAFFQDVCQELGHQPVLRAKLRGGLEFLRKQKAGLILYDLCLDRGQWDAICERALAGLVRVAGTTPVVGVTAKSLPQEQAFYLQEKGVKAFFDKLGGNADDLRAKLTKFLPDLRVRTPTFARTGSGFDQRDEYRSVNWCGQHFDFTPGQAAVVKLLHERLRAGHPDMPQGLIFETLRESGLNSDNDSKRLRDLFRKHSAWGTLIVKGQRRDTFRLNL
jgi:CheY-like chemotaxis protein